MELPARTPGAICRVELDTKHWLAFGYERSGDVLVASRNIFTPLKLDKGRNVGLFAPPDDLIRSGTVWPETLGQMAQKPYLLHQPRGTGHVAAFVEDPNFRGINVGAQLLFLNAVFFGPAH